MRTRFRHCRRPRTRIVAVVSCLAGLLAVPAVASAQQPENNRPAARPNILILVGDDHAGGTLGIDGDPRNATPRLDRLAREGVRFDRAYCNSPLCTPSRQSLITGKLPHAVGVTLLRTPLPDAAVTLGTWLGTLGYATGAIGKMHFNGPSKHGFDVRIDEPEWHDWLRAHLPPDAEPRRPWRPLVDPAAVWLNARAESAGLPASAMEATYFAERAGAFFEGHRDRPFLLVVGFHEPHSPFHFPKEYAGRYKADDFTAPPVSEVDRRDQPLIFRDLTPADVRGIQAAYYTSLAFLDASVGRVLDALEASGLARDTIVVYVGDNGYMLGQHGRFEKHIFYEPAVRVPLLVRWPGRLREGERTGALVEMVDIVPTLLDLAGLPAPPGLHGKTLAPLLRGEPGAAGRETVFGEYLENEEAMCRSARFKLVVGTGRRRREDGYVNATPTPGPYERLYDLASDPGEATDLAHEPELAAVKADLLAALHDRFVSTSGARAEAVAGLPPLEAIHRLLRAPELDAKNADASRAGRPKP